MPKQFHPRKRGAHRVACIALYRALLLQCPKIEVPAHLLQRGKIHPIAEIVRKQFRQNAKYESPTLVIAALKVGYEAEDLLHNAIQGDEFSRSRILHLLTQYQAQGHAERIRRSQSPPPPPKEKSPSSARYPNTPPTLEVHPRPSSEIKGRVRKVPHLVNANGIPFLRYSKPQPEFLSSLIRNKIRTRIKRHGILDKMQTESDEDSSVAAWEDDWEAKLEGRPDENFQAHGGIDAERNRVSLGWMKEPRMAWFATSAALEKEGMKVKEIAAKMTTILFKEQELAEQERTEWEREKRAVKRFKASEDYNRLSEGDKKEAIANFLERRREKKRNNQVDHWGGLPMPADATNRTSTATTGGPLNFSPLTTEKEATQLATIREQQSESKKVAGTSPPIQSIAPYKRLTTEKDESHGNHLKKPKKRRHQGSNKEQKGPRTLQASPNFLDMPAREKEEASAKFIEYFTNLSRQDKSDEATEKYFNELRQPKETNKTVIAHISRSALPNARVFGAPFMTTSATMINFSRSFFHTRAHSRTPEVTPATPLDALSESIISTENDELKHITTLDTREEAMQLATNQEQKAVTLLQKSRYFQDLQEEEKEGAIAKFKAHFRSLPASRRQGFLVTRYLLAMESTIPNEWLEHDAVNVLSKSPYIQNLMEGEKDEAIAKYRAHFSSLSFQQKGDKAAGKYLRGLRKPKGTDNVAAVDQDSGTTTRPDAMEKASTVETDESKHHWPRGLPERKMMWANIREQNGLTILRTSQYFGNLQEEEKEAAIVKFRAHLRGLPLSRESWHMVLRYLAAIEPTMPNEWMEQASVRVLSKSPCIQNLMEGEKEAAIAKFRAHYSSLSLDQKVDKAVKRYLMGLQKAAIANLREQKGLLILQASQYFGNLQDDEKDAAIAKFRAHFSSLSFQQKGGKAAEKYLMSLRKAAIANPNEQKGLTILQASQYSRNLQEEEKEAAIANHREQNGLTILQASQYFGNLQEEEREAAIAKFRAHFRSLPLLRESWQKVLRYLAAIEPTMPNEWMEHASVKILSKSPYIQNLMEGEKEAAIAKFRAHFSSLSFEQKSDKPVKRYLMGLGSGKRTDKVAAVDGNAGTSTPSQPTRKTSTTETNELENSSLPEPPKETLQLPSTREQEEAEILQAYLHSQNLPERAIPEFIAQFRRLPRCERQRFMAQRSIKKLSMSQAVEHSSSTTSPTPQTKQNVPMPVRHAAPLTPVSMPDRARERKARQAEFAERQRQRDRKAGYRLLLAERRAYYDDLPEPEKSAAVRTHSRLLAQTQPAQMRGAGSTATATATAAPGFANAEQGSGSGSGSGSSAAEGVQKAQHEALSIRRRADNGKTRTTAMKRRERRRAAKMQRKAHREGAGLPRTTSVASLPAVAEPAPKTAATPKPTPPLGLWDFLKLEKPASEPLATGFGGFHIDGNVVVDKPASEPVATAAELSHVSEGRRRKKRSEKQREKWREKWREKRSEKRENRREKRRREKRRGR